MRISWNDPTPPYDPDATRTGLTGALVYEIRSADDGWQLWVRPRVCRTGEHGLAVYDWEQIGVDYPTAAVAIVKAQMHADADETGRKAAAEAMQLLGWTRRVRVTRHILVHLSGSHAWQCPEDDDGYDGAAVRLMAKLAAAAVRADGSVTVELDAAERAALREYVEVEAIGAHENIEPPGRSYWPNDSLAEFNACQGLLRQLAKIEHSERVIDRCSS